MSDEREGGCSCGKFRYRMMGDPPIVNCGHKRLNALLGRSDG